jgi:hypothetical protein
MEQLQPYPTRQPRDAAPPYGHESAPTNVLAIVSLVLGVGSFVLVPFGPLASLPAVILGYIARSQITHRREGGAQLARWGLVLGYINLGLTALLFVLGAVVFALASYHVTVAGHPLY